MARRPIDYTAQMLAAEERRRLQEEKQREEAQKLQQLRQRLAISYGQVVLEILGDRTTIDELAGRLLDTKDRTTANPGLTTEWAARGEKFFRPAGNGQRKQPAGSNGTSGNGGQPGELPAREPSGSRPAAPAGRPDLLGGLAPDFPSAGAPGEGGGNGEQS